ncbi:hypothetical protein ADUPG1_002886, partial [Aduncisulcus paluster]
LYRKRHHAVRDEVIKSTLKVFPGLSIRPEVTADGLLRPDIVVEGSQNVYIEVTITYGDAGLQSLETATAKKIDKYASIQNLVVLAVTHCGCFLKSCLDDLEESLSLSSTQATRIMADAAQVAFRESHRILSIRYARSPQR